MNEEQIAQNLKQKTEPQEEVTSETLPQEPSNQVLNDGASLDMYKAMDHFEIGIQDRQNQQVLDQLDFVLTYAKANTETGDLLDAMNFLRSIESRLGLRFKGNRLHHLYHWVRLDQEARSIEVEKMNHVA